MVAAMTGTTEMSTGMADAMIDTGAEASATTATSVNAPGRNLWRDGLVVAVLVAAVVAVVTLGKPFIDIPGVVDAAAHRVRSLNLQLFNDWSTSSVWYGPYTNTFGNIALFIPVGAVLASLGQTGRWRYGQGAVVMMALLASLGIEATQYVFSLGYSDIDDVWTNTLGAAFGGILMARLDHELQAKILHRLGLCCAALLTILVCGLLAGVVG